MRKADQGWPESEKLMPECMHCCFVWFDSKAHCPLHASQRERERERERERQAYRQTENVCVCCDPKSLLKES